MDRIDWRLSPREKQALDTEVGRNAFNAARIAGQPEQAARNAAVEAYEHRCAVCGGSGVRCCEFGADR